MTLGFEGHANSWMKVLCVSPSTQTPTSSPLGIFSFCTVSPAMDQKGNLKIIIDDTVML